MAYKERTFLKRKQNFYDIFIKHEMMAIQQDDKGNWKHEVWFFTSDTHVKSDLRDSRKFLLLIMNQRLFPIKFMFYVTVMKKKNCSFNLGCPKSFFS